MSKLKAGQYVKAKHGYKEVEGTLLPSRFNIDVPRRFKDYYFIATMYSGKLRVTNVRAYE